MDKLKEYIEDQRADFDVYPFDGEAGWGQLEKKVSRHTIWPLWKIMSAAACLLLVFLGSFHQSQIRNESNALSEIEFYYESEINQKITLVKSRLDDPHILEDFAAMDQAFAELKADLEENVDNEEVIMAMMENYQLKLRILEEIITELEKEDHERSL